MTHATRSVSQRFFSGSRASWAKFVPAFAAICFLAIVTPKATAGGYTIQDLGTLGGSTSYVSGINEYGQASGWADTTGNVAVQSFFYSNNTMTNIGTAVASSYSAGINDSGCVVGYCYDASSVLHGFLYFNGQTVMLDSYGIQRAYANAINDAGTIVGTYQPSSKLKAFIYTNGTITSIGTYTSSQAVDINALGHVAGYAKTGTSTRYIAYVYKDGIATDIGCLTGGVASIAYAINNRDDVVGNSMTSSGANTAFLYSNNNLTSIPGLGTRSGANDINDEGHVVGSFLASNGEYHGYIYANGQSQDLNNLISQSGSWMVASAKSINNRGQIGGNGVLTSNGTTCTHAILMTPTACVWDGGGANGLWSTAANWVGDAVPVNGAAITFAGSANQYTDNYLLSYVGAITFANGGFDVAGNPITLNDGIVNTGENNLICDTTLGFDQSFVSLGGILSVYGSVATNGKTLTLSGSGSHIVTGPITGTGRLAKAGSGTAVLKTTNTYSGSTAIYSGTLQLGYLCANGLGANGSFGSGDVYNYAGLIVNNFEDSLEIANNISNSGTISVYQTVSGTTLFSGSIMLNSGVFVSNSGSTIICGGLSDSGTSAIIVNAGTLVLDDMTVNAPHMSIYVAAGASLVIGDGYYSLYSITGSGRVSVSGTIAVGVLVGDSLILGKNSAGKEGTIMTATPEGLAVHSVIRDGVSADGKRSFGRDAIVWAGLSSACGALFVFRKR